jgi:uncharacterized protein (DUF1501 family)
MFTIYGKKERFCDGISRRGFLKVGALAAGGITLPSLLRAESTAGAKATGKSIINIYLPGGPTHMDTFDLKPNAPKEYRGEFQPIKTSAEGLEICELMPRLASIGKKFSVVRSVAGIREEHAPTQSDSGWSESDLRKMGGRPGIGSVMSKVVGTSQNTARGALPTFVDVTGWTSPGFMGKTYAGYRPDGEARQNLQMNGSMTLERLGDRQTLLTSLDGLRRDADASGMMASMDSFTQRAVNLVTSGELARALDMKKEDPRNKERYGIDQNGENYRFLMARRLISAGVRCVGLSWGGWDTHGDNFNQMRRQLPPLDKALTALIEDLDAQGRLDDTIIMMSGEFGRTPRINGGAGRDHWAPASFFFLAGGGFRHGQAIGTTTRLGETAKDRPYHIHNIFYTVYKQLGIDADAVTLIDPNGRPQYLVDHRELVRELA